MTGQPQSSFEGNAGLCGLPLQETCFGTNSPPTQQPSEDEEEEEEEQVLNWKVNHKFKNTWSVKLKTERLLATTKQDVKEKDGQVTTKTLILPSRRHAVSANPESAAKTEEMVELFEAAKKAADVAKAKGFSWENQRRLATLWLSLYL
ncbi:hypothetical protein F2Q68_00027845 [Brassica cretica]|uniref:Uncharacterized protein n=1 Tax=Brassica cretica TaxID=69181 RepID=A0A8S9ICI9_BRACR|nr:hypothetical protein F2Q68_00027845 [Brassica cretica]